MYKLEHKSLKNNLLISTFWLAFYLVFAINILLIILNSKEIINKIELETITISIENGYYILNNIKIGFSIITNFIFLIAIWIWLIIKTLKSINKPIRYIFDKSLA